MIVIIDIDASEVRKGFGFMLDASGGSRSMTFFAEVKKLAKADIRERQRARRSPDGQAWPGRALSTRARAQYDGSKRKRSRKRRYPTRRKSASGGLLGRLPGGAKSHVESDGLTFSWPAGFGQAHNEGATVGNKAKLPARPFIGWSKGFMIDMHEEWAAYVADAWEKT